MIKKHTLINLVKIPKIIDNCFLLFVQNPTHVPFSIKRIFYILNADTKLKRGFHAHKKTKQILFCIQGSVRIVVDNGKKRKEIILNKPDVGIFFDKMVWHEMHDFKKNTIIIVLNSRVFEAKDYIRDYDRFCKLATK